MESFDERKDKWLIMQKKCSPRTIASIAAKLEIKAEQWDKFSKLVRGFIDIELDVHIREEHDDV